MNDTIKYKGYVIITDKNGSQRFDNIVTNGFYQLIADILAGNTTDTLSYFGFGTGTNVAAITDNALQTESGDRKTINFISTTGGVIHLQTTVNGNELIYTWRELGIFTEVTGGIMTNRVNINYVHNTGEAVTIDYYIQKQ